MAVTDHLLRTQLNAVFEEIRNAGLDPGEFELSEGYSGTSAGQIRLAMIRHPSSGYWFAVPGGFGFCRYSPGGETVVAAYRETKGGWFSVLEELRKWLLHLTREITTPDLWTSLRQEKELAEAGVRDSDDNRSFSPAEQQQIVTSLREIRSYLLKTATFLTEDQTRLINSRFAYLGEAATRLGKKDWITLAAGTFMNIVVAAALPSETARELFRVAGQTLRWLLRGQGMLP